MSAYKTPNGVLVIQCKKCKRTYITLLGVGDGYCNCGERLFKKMRIKK